MVTKLRSYKKYIGEEMVIIEKNKYEELPNNQSSYLWAHLRDLCKFGDIVEASPKIYSLTEEGKQRVLDKNYSNWRHYDKADWV